MTGLRQILCMYKVEKTQLNDRVAIGGFCCRQSTKDRNLKFAVYERQLNVLYNQYKQALN